MDLEEDASKKAKSTKVKRLRTSDVVIDLNDKKPISVKVIK